MKRRKKQKESRIRKNEETTEEERGRRERSHREIGGQKTGRMSHYLFVKLFQKENNPPSKNTNTLYKQDGEKHDFPP